MKHNGDFFGDGCGCPDWIESDSIYNLSEPDRFCVKTEENHRTRKAQPDAIKRRVQYSGISPESFAHLKFIPTRYLKLMTINGRHENNVIASKEGNFYFIVLSLNKRTKWVWFMLVTGHRWVHFTNGKGNGTRSNQELSAIYCNCK